MTGERASTEVNRILSRYNIIIQNCALSKSLSFVKTEARVWAAENDYYYYYRKVSMYKSLYPFRPIDYHSHRSFAGRSHLHASPSLATKRAKCFPNSCSIDRPKCFDWGAEFERMGPELTLHFPSNSHCTNPLNGNDRRQRGAHFQVR